jgi:hypothetical protein
MDDSPLMMAIVPPRILYVPVSGSAGSGERRRCEALAARVAELAPLAEQAIVGPFTSAAPLSSIELPGSPTRHPQTVIAAIDAFAPDWLVFDGNCRRNVLRHARRKGIAVVFIASRPSSRRRAFALRRIVLLDQIWLIEASPITRSLSWREALLLKICRRVSLRLWSTVHQSANDAAAMRRLAESGWQPGDYLLLCAGGGGQSIAGRPVNELLSEAGQIASKSTGLPVLIVGGDAMEAANIRHLPSLPQDELLALAKHARACLVGGGSLLPQCLSVGALCASVGWQDEQRKRVLDLAGNGLIVAAAPRPDSMANALTAVAVNPEQRSQLSTALRATVVGNGLDEAAGVLIGKSSR